jgi:hypothetical protein
MTYDSYTYALRVSALKKTCHICSCILLTGFVRLSDEEAIISRKTVKLYIHPCTGLDRPLGFQEVEVPRISRQSAHEGGKFVCPMHRPHLPPKRCPWYSFPLDTESTPEPQYGRKDQAHEKSQ